MAIAKIGPLPKSDMGTKIASWKMRHAAGKELRKSVPREAHADWAPWKGRPNPLDLLAESNKGRQKESSRCGWAGWPRRRSLFCAVRHA